MKVTIVPRDGLDLEDTDAELMKALTKKEDKLLNQKEQYSDPALNEFHAHIEREHEKVLNNIQEELRRLLT
jgi:hypothetical protein